jgi:hypothetical protein
MPRWSLIAGAAAVGVAVLGFAVWRGDRHAAAPGPLTFEGRGRVAPGPSTSEADSLVAASSRDREEAVEEGGEFEAGHRTSAAPVAGRNDPGAGEELQHSRKALRASLERFREDRSLTNAQVLMQRTVVAWADHTGSAQHYGPDDPVPEQVLTEEVWSIWVTNRFGSKLVTYTREEFPEYFVIRDLPGPGDSILNARLDEELLGRIDQRAQTVLDLMSER